MPFLNITLLPPAREAAAHCCCCSVLPHEPIAPLASRLICLRDPVEQQICWIQQLRSYELTAGGGAFGQVIVPRAAAETARCSGGPVANRCKTTHDEPVSASSPCNKLLQHELMGQSRPWATCVQPPHGSTSGRGAALAFLQVVRASSSTAQLNLQLKSNFSRSGPESSTAQGCGHSAGCSSKCSPQLHAAHGQGILAAIAP